MRGAPTRPGLRWAGLIGAGLIGAGLIPACGPVSTIDTFNPGVCDPRTLLSGEVRARRMPCAAEAPSGGDGRSGDWILENAQVRFVVRGAYATLTQLGLEGGTLIDAARAGGADLLVEATPTFEGRWFEDVEISAWNEEDAAGISLTGTLDDGSPAELSYRLEADAELLELSQAASLLVVPPAGSVAFGSTYEAGADGLDPGEAPLFAATGALSDLGGWLVWEGADAITVGERDAVHALLWPRGLDVSGSADGDWVEALDADDVPLARLSVRDGAFAGRVPVETLSLRAATPGYAAGPGSLPGEDRALSLGAAGFLQVRVTDDQGQDLPATLYWEGQPWPMAAGGETLALGPGTGPAAIWAGPACEALFFDELTLSETSSLEAVLPCAEDPPLLAELGREAWPDRDEGRRAEDVLFAAAAEGVGYAVLVADDEVAPVAMDRHTAEHLMAEPGSRADTDTLGALVAWPWSPDARDPAHGAADWPGIAALTLLNAMTRVADRVAVVEPAWVAAAGSPTGWARPPRGLRLGSLEDLPTFTGLLDAWVPIAATGPRTWMLEVPEVHATVDIVAALVAGRTVASNGPRLTLSVDGAGPGGALPFGPLRDVGLRVEAPSWMPLSGAALIGSGGVELARWDLTGAEPVRLDARVERLALARGWVLAVAWGEEAVAPLLETPAWAVSSPVWIGRP